MSDLGRPIGEEELHAYVDDRLEAGTTAGDPALPAGASRCRAARRRLPRATRGPACRIWRGGGRTDPAAARSAASDPGAAWAAPRIVADCSHGRAGVRARRRRGLVPAWRAATTDQQPHAADAGGGGQSRRLHRGSSATDRTGGGAARRSGAVGVQPVEPPGRAAGPVRRRLSLHGRAVGRDAGRSGRAVHVRRRPGLAADRVRNADGRRRAARRSSMWISPTSMAAPGSTRASVTPWWANCRQRNCAASPSRSGSSSADRPERRYVGRIAPEGNDQSLHVRPVWHRGRHADGPGRGCDAVPARQRLAGQSELVRHLVAADAFREFDDRRTAAPGAHVVSRDRRACRSPM